MKTGLTKPIAASKVLVLTAICSTLVTAGFTNPSHAQSNSQIAQRSTNTTNGRSPSSTNRYSPPLPGYQELPFQTIPDAFNHAFSKRSGDYFRNDTIGSQFNFVFGIGGYSDRQITHDANLIETLYRDFMEQQVSGDAIIRTPDLENPFNSSLLTTTTYIQPPPPAYTPPPPPVYNPPPAVEPPPPIPRALY
ncbi:hypothetical protein [Merismopedia glauca]|uniref:Porin n=1 Tax=Merismopedia glauca CCAP 1448/3 TaxID=1296344 RepID=A0A2T1CA04_9CYAN|nr:hypothetical protein [Merismopedia glauca]PSB05105.1 hypothetical protein C7B64_00950 [Merismopedia glauca CCAP 1448/3]